MAIIRAVGAERRNAAVKAEQQTANDARKAAKSSAAAMGGVKAKKGNLNAKEAADAVADVASVVEEVVKGL